MVLPGIIIIIIIIMNITQETKEREKERDVFLRKTPPTFIYYIIR